MIKWLKTLFSRVLTYEPDDVEVWARREEVLKGLKKVRKAMKCFDETLKKDPSHDEAWFMKGEYFCQMKNYREDKISTFNRKLPIMQRNCQRSNKKNFFFTESIGIPTLTSSITPMLIISQNFKHVKFM